MHACESLHVGIQSARFRQETCDEHQGDDAVGAEDFEMRPQLRRDLRRQRGRKGRQRRRRHMEDVDRGILYILWGARRPMLDRDSGHGVSPLVGAAAGGRVLEPVISHLHDESEAGLAVTQDNGGRGGLSADLHESFSLSPTGRRLRGLTDLDHLGGAETPPVDGGDGDRSTFVYDAGLETLESGQVAPQLGFLLIAGRERGRRIRGDGVGAEVSLVGVGAEPRRIGHVQGGRYDGLGKEGSSVEE